VTILADILPGNDASIRLFTAAGFSPVPPTEGIGAAESGAPMPTGIIQLQRR
jgi:hypothetical protein